MPFGISQSQSDCSGWATVFRDPDGTYATIGCHTTKQDAIDQMVAASLNEGTEPLGQVDARSVRADGYEPTGAMKDEARKGLEWRAEYNRGGTEIGVARARDISNGRSLSLDTVQRMSSYFARHEVDKQAEGWSPGEDGFPSAGRIAWALWGGDPGRTWANAILDAEDDRDGMEWDVVEPPDEEPEEDEEAVVETRDVTALECDKEITMSSTVLWASTTENETRRIAYTNLEVRAEGDGATLVGYAAVWDSPSEPLPWIEYVKRGAFSKTLNDGADVRLLVDHEGVPLARTTSGTLKLTEDDRGLRTEATLDPANPDAARLMSALRRGDVSQMSFMFRVVKDAWNTDRTSRELREVQLYDVSVVTFPAYEATVAELRAKSAADTLAATGTPVLLRQRQIDIARRR